MTGCGRGARGSRWVAGRRRPRAPGSTPPPARRRWIATRRRTPPPPRHGETGRLARGPSRRQELSYCAEVVVGGIPAATTLAEAPASRPGVQRARGAAGRWRRRRPRHTSPPPHPAEGRGAAGVRITLRRPAGITGRAEEARRRRREGWGSGLRGRPAEPGHLDPPRMSVGVGGGGQGAPRAQQRQGRADPAPLDRRPLPAS